LLCVHRSRVGAEFSSTLDLLSTTLNTQLHATSSRRNICKYPTISSNQFHDHSNIFQRLQHRCGLPRVTTRSARHHPQHLDTFHGTQASTIRQHPKPFVSTSIPSQKTFGSSSRVRRLRNDLAHRITETVLRQVFRDVEHLDGSDEG
jgi:hypothetical protein